MKTRAQLARSLSRNGLWGLSIAMGMTVSCTQASGGDGVSQHALALGAAGGSAGVGMSGSGGGVAVDGGVAGVGAAGFGMGGFGGAPGDGGTDDGVADPIGNWKLDDCKKAKAALLDSSPSAANATKSSTVVCGAGADALGVTFAKASDTVTVPALETFDLTDHLAIATWVNVKSTKVGTKGTFVVKEQGTHRPFALTQMGPNVVFTAEIDTMVNNRAVTKTFSSKAPITANTWTHVAGVYDGQFLLLFVNGQQVGQVAAAGVVHDVRAPLSFGNDAAGVFLNGSLDEVWLSVDPIQDFEVAQLACIHHPLKVSTAPLASGTVAPGVTFSYQITLTNADFGSCGSSFAFISASQQDEGISAVINDSFETLDPGQSVTVAMDVTGSNDADAGAHNVGFNVFGDGNDVTTGSVQFTMSAPTGCFVRTSRDLMITNLSVVEDPVRTVWVKGSSDARSGAWTFGRLMQQMAPTAAGAPAFVEKLFKTWLTDQKVNTFSVPARPAMQQLVLDSWPRASNGQLDLTKAPLRLLAIVDRLDLRDLNKGQAGEGRFVFGVLDSSGFQTQFTLILEYRLPAKTTADVVAWANSWHDLQTLPVPSEAYNVALQKITDRFTARNAEPSRPNGSALGQLRTNEIALSSPWELREFQIGTNGSLAEVTVKLTPDTSFISGSTVLGKFVNQNEAAILQEKHTVPEKFQNKPFLGGSSFNDLNAWTAPNITNNEARFHFSLNTCNGCHSASETGTFFLQISPRDPGQTAQLSGFLAGTDVSDPVTGVPRHFDDLGRRNVDLQQIVCPVAMAAATPAAKGAAAASPADTSAREAFLSKGIDRVH